MTPQEKSLIDSVFDRLAQGGSGAKDAEALTYMRDRAARLPDSIYGLVQAVLIQEMTINQAAARVAELERQVAQGAAPAQGSSFLGGAGPWGQAPGTTSPARAAAPQPQAQPAYQPQPQLQPQAGPWGAPASGGGFLRNMASMAAGVAGGTLLAEGISSLFGGRHMFGGGFGGVGGFGPFGGSPGMVENVENVTVNNYGDSAPGSDGLPQDDQGGYQDASFTDSGDDGSSFDGGDSGFDGGGFSDT
jgi:hypothetical protein